MFNPTVQLKSGGYIVIGVTEALVAIDVNSGRATKEGSIEETALKTNLEASDEVARQLRLRDLAGLIVIDYIDMDERRNNNAVEKRLKDRLKNDRARIQVGRISGFGLMEMSRQRLRPGMIEATTQPCSHCHGTGLIRSDENLALSILRQLEEEGTRKRSREVLLKAPVGIVNYLMNNKREHIAQIEARYGLSIRIEADPFLVSPDFSIEKFKTASRVVKQVSAPVVSGSAAIMDDIDDAEVVEEETPVETADEGEAQPKKRRRRRRRRRGRGGDNAEATQNGEEAVKTDAAPEGEAVAEVDAKDDAGVETPAEAPAESEEKVAEKAEDEKPKRKPRKRAPRKSAKAADADVVEATVEEAAPEEAAEEPKKKPVRRRRKKADADEAPKAEEDVKSKAAAEDEKPAPKKRVRRKPAAKKAKVEEVEVKPEAAPEPTAAPEVEPVKAAPAPKPAPEPTPKPAPKADKPKRKGWWSLGR